MAADEALGEGVTPRIVSVRRIWDRAPHNAFTDLIRIADQWWCTFREAADHAASVGTLRVLCSKDGEQFESMASIAEDGVDLRDPKLSVMPDGRVLLVAGGSLYEGTEYRTRAPRVAFSSDGRVWTPPRRVLAEDHWLWRVTWHQGVAYSVSKLGEGHHPRRGFLYSSRDCLDWQWITEFLLPDDAWNASETTLRFMPDDELVALTRPHWIGTSRPPYGDWNWTKIGATLGGPDFVRSPAGLLWAASRGRDAEGKTVTVLARMTRSGYEQVLELPSGGDCSYPGMVWHDDHLWMTYYSSHEGKTSIYLARIGFDWAGGADSGPPRRGACGAVS